MTAGRDEPTGPAAGPAAASPAADASGRSPGFRALRECRVIELPRIGDVRGNLTFVESERSVPFRVRRTYWVYDVPGGERRSAGHAYRRLEEFIVALSGSFAVTVSDGTEERRFTLNRSYFGLYVPNTLWRRIDDFSTNAVCLVFASTAYDREDYVRDRGVFRDWRAGATP